MKRIAGIWKTHLAILLFGLSGPLSVCIGLPAMDLSMGRYLIAALALLLFIRPAWAALKQGMKDHWPSGLLLAFHWFGFFHATIEGSVAWGLLSYATYPLWTILFSRISERSWPDKKELSSVALILLGTFLLVKEDVEVLGQEVILIGLASAAAFALLQLRNAGFMKQEKSLNLAAYQMLWAGLFLIPFSSLSSFQLAPFEWSLFLFHGLIITAFSYSLFLSGLREIGKNKASYIAALEPVYGLLIAMVLLGTIPSWIQCIAAVLILIPSFLKGN